MSKRKKVIESRSRYTFAEFNDFKQKAQVVVSSLDTIISSLSEGSDDESKIKAIRHILKAYLSQEGEENLINAPAEKVISTMEQLKRILGYGEDICNKYMK